MLLKELKCKSCGAPIKSKERDMMLKCSHCGRISLYTKTNGLCDLDYTIAGASKDGKGTLVYVPFWIVSADLDVKRESIAGGRIGRFLTDQKQMRGSRKFYVCASNAIPEKFSRVWNMDLTLGQPELNSISDFKDGSRLVMNMEQEIAGENAEFLFLRYETEIPGTLQELDYDFRIKDTKVAFLPAWKEESRTGGEFTLAI